MHSLLDRALAAARQLGASDIHLKGGLAPILRIDGELRTLSDVPPLSREFVQSLAMSLLNDRRREILERTGDVALSITATDGSRQRLHVWQHRGGTAVAVRLVPAQAPALAKLDLPPGVAALVAGGRRASRSSRARRAPGKTTTLASLVDHVGGERACHVITVEDPVEIVLKDRRSVVVQREVGLDAPTTAAALRAALRQDADVVAVGELRDAESVELAIFAAETGRLVLAGLAARDAVGAVARLLELGGASERSTLRPRLATVLRGIVAQQLVPRADGKGRRAAAELLLVDDETRRLLRDPAGEAPLRAALLAGRPPGSQSFDATLVALARAARISAEHAIARATDAAAVRELLAETGASAAPRAAPERRPPKRTLLRTTRGPISLRAPYVLLDPQALRRRPPRLPRLLQGAGPQGGRELVAGPAGRPDAAVRERGHEPVQGLLHGQARAGLLARDDGAEVRARRRQAQRPRQRRPHGAPPHVLRDARQLLVRRLLQGRRHQVRLRPADAGRSRSIRSASSTPSTTRTTRRGGCGRRSPASPTTA